MKFRLTRRDKKYFIWLGILFSGAIAFALADCLTNGIDIVQYHAFDYVIAIFTLANFVFLFCLRYPKEEQNTKLEAKE